MTMPSPHLIPKKERVYSQKRSAVWMRGKAMRDPAWRKRTYAKNRKWRKEHPKEVAEREFKKRLKGMGLTVDDYDAMLKKQNGCCALCGHPPKRFRLNVDHDH